MNVDETTYMFSPKVLDRANVLEFRVEANDIQSYLAEPHKLWTYCKSADMVQLSVRRWFALPSSRSTPHRIFVKNLSLKFAVLQRT